MIKISIHGQIKIALISYNKPGIQQSLLLSPFLPSTSPPLSPSPPLSLSLPFSPSQTYNSSPTHHFYFYTMSDDPSFGRRHTLPHSPHLHTARSTLISFLVIYYPSCTLHPLHAQSMLSWQQHMAHSRGYHSTVIAGAFSVPSCIGYNSSPTVEE